jgi:hypothetical protein
MAILPANSYGAFLGRTNDIAQQRRWRTNQNITRQILPLCPLRQTVRKRHAIGAQTIHFPVSGNQGTTLGHQGTFPWLFIIFTGAADDQNGIMTRTL